MALSGFQLTEWNKQSSAKEVMHRTQRDMYVHERNNEGFDPQPLGGTGPSAAPSSKAVKRRELKKTANDFDEVIRVKERQR
ncbi:hypothetical protein Bca101_002714 [Brassica carinata]